MKKQKGRPKKRTTVKKVIQESTRQRKPPAVPKRKNTTAASVPTSDNKETQKKNTRTNWSIGEDFKRMTIAVEDWLEKKGNALDENGEAIALKSYSRIVNIPYKTLEKYVIPDPSKRRQLGKSVGKKPILDASDRKFMTDVLRRADRGNEGMNRSKAIDTMQELYPERALSRATCSKVLTRRILEHPDNNGKIKKKPVVAQSTTTKGQQLRMSNSGGGIQQSTVH